MREHSESTGREEDPTLVLYPDGSGSIMDIEKDKVYVSFDSFADLIQALANKKPDEA